MNIPLKGVVVPFLLYLYSVTYARMHFILTTVVIIIIIFLFLTPFCSVLNCQAEELKKQIGALAYVECSSKTQQVSLTYLFTLSNRILVITNTFW